MTSTSLPDSVDRLILKSLRDGTAPTLDQAILDRANSAVGVIASHDTCSSISGQAAILTAVVTAVRAFGTVFVYLDDRSPIVCSGLFRGQVLADAVRAEGGTLIDDSQHANDINGPVIVLGHPSVALNVAEDDSDMPVIYADWQGWTAHLAPVPLGTPRLEERENVLAAVAAGALAVAESFESILQRPGSLAGFRDVALNLWNPTGSDLTDEPELGYAPSKWWLVGLGHLGQAYGWVIGALPFADPGQVSVVLQDDATTVPANHSTGVLTPKDSQGEMKGRLVSSRLEAASYETRILERRMDIGQRTTEAEGHVALIGVDNVTTRRAISGVGWNLAVDAGLGRGSQDFSAMVLRRFPGSIRSEDVVGWRDTVPEATAVPRTSAFAGLAETGRDCGTVELAGKAVGASFVGVVAACLAIAEASRGLHGGDGFDAISFNVASTDVMFAGQTVPVRIAGAKLTGG